MLLLSATAFAQNNDPVVMTVAGYDVTRSEFEYNFNKNNTEGVIDKKTIEEYAELFINYRMKVQAALDAKKDTTKSFRDEFRTYRDQLIRPLLVSDENVEGEARKYYEGMLAQLNGHDLRYPAHIFMRLPQGISAEEQAQKKNRIDSISAAIKAGADFAEMAKKYSEEKSSGDRGGELGWFGPGQLVPEFENVMYSLKKGEISEPFSTTYGYHIVRLNDVKELEPYDTLRSQILNFLERRGVREHLATQMVDSLSQQKSMTVEEFLDAETERLCARDNELRFLVQEYHDGLLMYDIWKENVVDVATKDTAAIEKLFKANKKKYAWDKPHFYGMTYYTRNQSDVKAVKKLLKKVDESKWTKTVREAFNKDSVTVRMQQKLYVLGDDPLVDSLVFKVKGVKYKERKDFPYAGVIGRAMKKGPQKWTDVASEVTSDCQQKREEQYSEELRKKYSYEIYRDVLDTVNKH